MNKKIAIILNAFSIKNFKSGGEKVNYYIIKALFELGYEIDVFCSDSEVTTCKYVKNIFIGTKPEKSSNTYILTISENLFTHSNIRYIHENTRNFRDKYTRSAFDKFICKVFANKRHKVIQKMTENQKKLAQNTDLLIAPSNFIKNDLIEAFEISENKIKILPPFCETNTKDFSQKEKDKFTFGMSARGFSTKGGYNLILATILLKLRGINCKTIIIYPFSKSSQKLQYLLNLLGLNNTIKLISYCENMNDFYAQIDCLVMASKREAFGLVAVEAIARKIPVLINTRCGIKDFIKNEENGFVYDHKHPILNLYKAMRNILNNKKLEQITNNALEIDKELNYETFKIKLNNIICNYTNLNHNN